MEDQFADPDEDSNTYDLKSALATASTNDEFDPYLKMNIEDVYKQSTTFSSSDLYKTRFFF